MNERARRSAHAVMDGAVPGVGGGGDGIGTGGILQLGYFCDT